MCYLQILKNMLWSETGNSSSGDWGIPSAGRVFRHRPLWAEPWYLIAGYQIFWLVPRVSSKAAGMV